MVHVAMQLLWKQGQIGFTIIMFGYTTTEVIIVYV